MFSFGYWGWGTSTRELVRLVDSIEKHRGFQPPVFVDIRLNCQVRAPGFNGKSFCELVGVNRHRWMKALGNRSVRDGGTGIVIDHPDAVHSLLDVALLSAAQNTRVIFFCACPRQKEDGNVLCHRWKVAELALAAARERGVSIQVVEWPGGDFTEFEMKVDRPLFRSIDSGRRNIPLPSSMKPAVLQGPAWASVATFRCGDETVRRLVGPAVWEDGKWHLPLAVNSVKRPPFRNSEEDASHYRDSEGWSPRNSV